MQKLMSLTYLVIICQKITVQLVTGTCTRCPSLVPTGVDIPSDLVTFRWCCSCWRVFFCTIIFESCFLLHNCGFLRTASHLFSASLTSRAWGGRTPGLGGPEVAAGRSSRLRSARTCACPCPDPTLCTHVWRALPGRPPASCSQSSASWHCPLPCWEPWPDYLECVWARPRPLRLRTPCQSSSEPHGVLTCRLISEVEQARREASVPLKAPGSARYFWFQRISKTRAVGKSNHQMLQLLEMFSNHSLSLKN